MTQDIEKALRGQANRTDKVYVLAYKSVDISREVRSLMLQVASHDFLRTLATEEDLKEIKSLMDESIAALKKSADNLSKIDARVLEIARRDPEGEPQ